MKNFTASYKKILNILHSLVPNINFLDHKRKPKLSDIGLIVVDLTSEYMSIYSKYQFFKVLLDWSSIKIERSVYNRGKRNLFSYRGNIKRKW